jgi:demethylmenaquinone methyltransferase/2-methoxy-6-polyprenyl-1,4-benzoquinol methylase
MVNTNLVSYYQDRAKEYDKIYFKPERQADLQRATEILKEKFKNKDLLEIACGTGYWTEKIAETAKFVLATDINNTVIEIARQKDYPGKNVAFECADIYKFQPDKKYENLFAGFILSHIPLQEIDNFLKAIHNFVLPGGNIVVMDNTFVGGSNHPITRTDEFGNTFQTRKLDNGTVHEVLKNFLSQNFLREKISAFATEIEFIQLEYYWILSYNLK